LSAVRPARRRDRTADDDAIRELGWRAPVMNHSGPLITSPAPSRRIVAAMMLASGEATSGSDIARQERIARVSNGSGTSGAARATRTAGAAPCCRYRGGDN
jgi:hypothetical protein